MAATWSKSILVKPRMVPRMVPSVKKNPQRGGVSCLSGSVCRRIAPSPVSGADIPPLIGWWSMPTGTEGRMVFRHSMRSFAEPGNELPVGPRTMIALAVGSSTGACVSRGGKAPGGFVVGKCRWSWHRNAPMWPALDSTVRLPTSLTRPRPLLAGDHPKGRGSNALPVPYARATQRHARQEAAGANGRRVRPRRKPRRQRTDGATPARRCGAGRLPARRPNEGSDGPQREEFRMASPSQRLRLSQKARYALNLLAVDQRGLTETLLLTYGFTRRMLAELVRAGLATASARPSRLAARRSRSFASGSLTPASEHSKGERGVTRHGSLSTTPH